MDTFDLKARRLELGLTLEDVGKIVGVSKSTVRKWETGFIENMKRDKISLLAKALQISPATLVGMGDTGKVVVSGVNSEGKYIAALSRADIKSIAKNIERAGIVSLLREKYELPEEAESEIEFFVDYIISKYKK